MYGVCLQWHEWIECSEKGDVVYELTVAWMRQAVSRIILVTGTVKLYVDFAYNLPNSAKEMPHKF